MGWAISNRMKQDLALRALNMAIAIRRPPLGCVHHTDRGSQYCAHDYQNLLRKHGFKGLCCANPVTAAPSLSLDRPILRAA